MVVRFGGQISVFGYLKLIARRSFPGDDGRVFCSRGYGAARLFIPVSLLLTDGEGRVMKRRGVITAQKSSLRNFGIVWT